MLVSLIARVLFCVVSVCLSVCLFVCLFVNFNDSWCGVVFVCILISLTGRVFVFLISPAARVFCFVLFVYLFIIFTNCSCCVCLFVCLTGG